MMFYPYNIGYFLFYPINLFIWFAPVKKICFGIPLEKKYWFLNNLLGVFQNKIFLQGENQK